MAFALWVMVLYSGLLSGYLNGMARDVLDDEVGDIQVFATGYLDDPSIYRRIADVDARVAALEAAGYRVAPRLMAGALAAHGDQSSGVQLRGIDVARDASALRVSTRLLEGAWVAADDPEGVVVGRRVGRTLGVHPGDELLVLTQGADGSMANELFHVRGVLAPVGDATDRTAVFMPADTFRSLMVVPDGVHQLIVRVPDGTELDAAAAAVSQILPDDDVRTWRRLMPTVATMLDSTKSLVYIVFAIVYVAVGILILNAMLMAVFERIREFGVMKALGVGPTLVARLILVEAGYQSGIAVAIGLAAAVPAAVYLSRVGIDMTFLSGASVAGMALPPIWRATFTPDAVAGPVVMLLVIVGLAVAIPTVRAATLRPLDAMRYV